MAGKDHANVRDDIDTETTADDRQKMTPFQQGSLRDALRAVAGIGVARTSDEPTIPDHPVTPIGVSDTQQQTTPRGEEQTILLRRRSDGDAPDVGRSSEHAVQPLPASSQFEAPVTSPPVARTPNPDQQGQPVAVSPALTVAQPGTAVETGTQMLHDTANVVQSHMGAAPVVQNVVNAAREPGPTPAPVQRAETDFSPPTVGIRGAQQASMDQAKTQMVRGPRRPTRTDFHQEPVVAWLVVIGGPGLGAFRAIYEGNNSIGRAATQRVSVDFGDDTISAEEQAFIRYDASDREFLFVPNLAKTNVVSINEIKPTSAVKLSAMDVITMGQTQLVFVPFCGEDFDWSELADL